MLIEMHVIQNHSPANLNRDDLGAPKTCYFGGVLRSRISSQCIKRSIRKSDEFKLLCGGIRTRRLPKHLAEQIKEKDVLKLAEDIVQKCGVLHDEEQDDKKKDVIVFLSKSAAAHMVKLLREAPEKTTEKEIRHLARQFAEIIQRERYVPDMALSGRMLEPAKTAKDVWQNLNCTVEAALQVGHAISTHEARPEVDYFVAADDVKGEDAGGAHIGEAMFASACFYKYFSIHWETLVANLKGNKELAAHTVGAFLRGAATVNPTGKQNSFAAHNPPDGILIEIRNTPVSYANAFAKPAAHGERDLISQSIAQLAQYVHDLDSGYGAPEQEKCFWFSPNLRYPLTVVEDKKEITLTKNNIKSLDELITAVVAAIGHDWKAVQKVVVNSEVAP
jgi:CRISPR system Cascade subunit CasC